MSNVRQQASKAGIGNVSAPAINTAAVVTLAANATKRHYLTQIDFSYEGAAPAANGNLIVEDEAGTTVFNIDIALEGDRTINFFNPLRGRVNKAMVITLAAGGASVTGKLSIGAYTDQ